MSHTERHKSSTDIAVNTVWLWNDICFKRDSQTTTCEKNCARENFFDVGSPLVWAQVHCTPSMCM